VASNRATPVIRHTEPEPVQTPEVVDALLFISMAEEMFDIAHSGGAMAALSTHNDDLERYYSLVATGLGCLETTLKV
jgi:Cohesin loading factor